MSNRTLIQRLFADHAGALQAFFRKRVRAGFDVLDLTQEAYLRLLRAAESRPIINPEAYLFTVANNLVKERHVMQRRENQHVELSDPAVAGLLKSQTVELEMESDLDRETNARSLRRVLPELAPRSRLAIVLAFEEELSHQEIARRLGISKTMVHKILTQALAHCRKRIMQSEAS